MLILFLITLSLWSSEEERDPKKAMMLSFAVPGLGELYMGERDDALRAFAIEGAIIISYLGFHRYGDILRDDYIKYGKMHAGISSGMNEDYYEAVEWYRSREAYNIGVREEARRLFPRDRERQLKYIADNEIPEEHSWKWEDAEWLVFRDLRRRERETALHASYCIGLSIANRIISAIISRRMGEERKINLYLEPKGVRVSYRF